MKQVFSSNLVGHLEMILISLLRPHALFAHPTGYCCADLLIWLVTICNGSCRALLALVSRSPHTCSSQASSSFSDTSQPGQSRALPSLWPHCQQASCLMGIDFACARLSSRLS